MEVTEESGVYIVTCSDEKREQQFFFKGENFQIMRARAFMAAEHLNDAGYGPVTITLTKTTITTTIVATLD